MRPDDYAVQVCEYDSNKCNFVIAFSLHYYYYTTDCGNKWHSECTAAKAFHMLCAYN